jgi:hypothetical protein
MTMQRRDIGSLIALKRATPVTRLTAGGAGDNTQITGVILDRAALGWPESMVLHYAATAVLGAGATLSLTREVLTSNAANMAGAQTLSAQTAAVVATGGAGGSTEHVDIEQNISLAGAGRYIQVNPTPDLSAANTDVAQIAVTIAFGGQNRLPA